jgi:lipopolysaccharide/colanic/teichoic acid biosynthesis glycosyltransferase
MRRRHSTDQSFGFLKVNTMSFAVGREELAPAPAARLTQRRCETKPAPYHTRGFGFGRVLAVLLLICGAPLMLLTVVIIRLTSPGPVIYRQIRVGRGGRHFVMYKFRTMRQDAEAGTGAVWTSKNDPRITTAGRLIRALHLDELPQLINVLKGEMVLMGPRPERPEFTQQLALALPDYLDRLTVRPGITGLAQINLPPDTDLESVRRKLVLDLLYVREGSLWLDFSIFACTAARLLAIKGPLVTRVFGLRRLPEDVMAVQGERSSQRGAGIAGAHVPDAHGGHLNWPPCGMPVAFTLRASDSPSAGIGCSDRLHDNVAPRLPR